MKKQEKLVHLVKGLLDAIDKNTTGLWTDDISETIDCIVLNGETFTEGIDWDATEVSYTGIQKHLESIENLLNQMEEKHDLKTWAVRPDKLKYMGSERYMQKVINFSVDVVAKSLQEAQDIVRYKYNLNPYYFTFKTTEK
tara:strand:- start:199 stop:618 length:420 start_codon:yes stop_codon:yes gene_type:complete